MHSGFTDLLVDVNMTKKQQQMLDKLPNKQSHHP